MTILWHHFPNRPVRIRLQNVQLLRSSVSGNYPAHPRIFIMDKDVPIFIAALPGHGFPDNRHGIMHQDIQILVSLLVSHNSPYPRMDIVNQDVQVMASSLFSHRHPDIWIKITNQLLNLPRLKSREVQSL